MACKWETKLVVLERENVPRREKIFVDFCGEE